MIKINNSFIVVYLNEEDADKLIANNTTTTLKQPKFEIIIPPHLMARKTVITKQIDRDVKKKSEEEIENDIEGKNRWAKVEEVVKFLNMPYLLQIRFTDIKMARKAAEIGFLIDTYHLNSSQVGIMEDYIQLTPSCACYT